MTTKKQAEEAWLAINLADDLGEELPIWALVTLRDYIAEQPDDSPSPSDVPRPTQSVWAPSARSEYAAG